MIQTLAVGPTAHVFLCIDANKNDKCSDEQVVDLNTLSAQVVAGGLQVGADLRKGDLTNVGACQALGKGVVFFHKLHKFVATDETSTFNVTTSDYAAAAAQEILKNHSSNTTTTTTNNGTVVNFPIRLGKANADLCPKPSVRTDGCFVKGTKIAVTKEMTMPIEDLHLGSPVYMADGRTMRVSRIIAGPEAKPVLTFGLGAGHQITVTSEHPLVTNKGLRLAKDIGFGEELMTADGNYATILSITASQYKDLVYNFEFEGTKENDHLIIAEGVVSGDLYLQNKMSKEAANKATQMLGLNGSQR